MIKYLCELLNNERGDAGEDMGSLTKKDLVELERDVKLMQLNVVKAFVSPFVKVEKAKDKFILGILNGGKRLCYVLMGSGIIGLVVLIIAWIKYS